MKAKLNIQSIRVAERLLKKPFGKFDLNNDKEALALMYGMVVSNNEEVFTIEQFEKILEQKKTRKTICSSFLILKVNTPTTEQNVDSENSKEN